MQSAEGLEKREKNDTEEKLGLFHGRRDEGRTTMLKGGVVRKRRGKKGSGRGVIRGSKNLRRRVGQGQDGKEEKHPLKRKCLGRRALEGGRPKTRTSWGGQREKFLGKACSFRGRIAEKKGKRGYLGRKENGGLGKGGGVGRRIIDYRLGLGKVRNGLAGII